MSFPDLRTHRSSIQIRLLVSSILLLVVGLAAMSWMIERDVRKNMQEMLGRQQLATTSALASMIDQEVRDRLIALEKVSARFSEIELAKPAEMQKDLTGLVVLQHLFTAGVFVTDAQGTALASVPTQPPRVGLYYGDRDYIRQSLQQGVPQVGKPIIGKVLGEKVLGLAVPIFNKNRQVIGTIAGVTNLDRPNFLDQIYAERLSHNATVLIVSRKHRQIIMSSDRRRIMETLPPIGVSPQLDRFIAGQDGNSEFENPLGIRVLASVRQVPSADWCIAIATPVSSIYAPVRDMEWRLGMSILSFAAVLAWVLWWLLRRELTPLEQTAHTLHKLALPGAKLEPLPITRDDEIGMVLQGFNHLLGELSIRQVLLADSEKTYRTAFAVSPDALAISRVDDGVFLRINEGFTRLLGYSEAETIEHSAIELGIWPHADEREKILRTLRETGHVRAIETVLQHKNGRLIPVEVSASRLQVQGQDAMMSVCHDLSMRKATQQTIRNLAEFDALTRLPNRNLFMRRLAQAVEQSLSSGDLGALLCIDLDDFKTLNDTLGHDIGDQFLRAMALRLRENESETMLAGRLGGDEFVVMLNQLGSDESEARAMAIQKAKIIQDLLSAPVSIQGRDYQRSVCIGLSLFGLRAESPREAIKRSDLAMYKAKSSGRQTITAFEAWMQTSLSARSDLESRLRTAILSRSLLVHFQPQARNGEIFGAEALLRWKDPDLGWISPADFIPLAEESGLIQEAGAWVLQTVCDCLHAWQHDPVLGQLTVSVNISAHQFMRDDFVFMVQQVLAQTQAPAQHLKLEITESLLIQDIEGINRKMLELRALGVGFSLDDFGTGYSSLSYLKRLPLDQLKIDQSFVRDILTDSNDAAIAQMIVALGNTLKLNVIAEGVETEAQRSALARMGCQCYQGYLLGPAMPLQEIEQMIRDHVRQTSQPS